VTLQVTRMRERQLRAHLLEQAHRMDDGFAMCVREFVVPAHELIRDDDLSRRYKMHQSD
jgi:hypothetical protein